MIRTGTIIIGTFLVVGCATAPVQPAGAANQAGTAAIQCAIGYADAHLLSTATASEIAQAAGVACSAEGAAYGEAYIAEHDPQIRGYARDRMVRDLTIEAQADVSNTALMRVVQKRTPPAQ